MSDTTKLTEIVTGLGMVGGGHPLHTLPVLPGELRNVDAATWDAVVAGWHAPDRRRLVDAAFENGRFFAAATEGLRGRPPRLIEWTGPQRAPGDEVAPVDLRIDHVYLVSCKYFSKITMNASPSHLFERLLLGGHGRRATDWYRAVAEENYDTLLRASREWVTTHGTRVDDGADPVAQRRVFAAQLRGPGGGWPTELREPYDALCAAVAVRSAVRWNDAVRTGGRRAAEAMLWRLLRIGSAPYFVLGVDGSGAAPLRLRVASPWDWRQHFDFKRLDITPLAGGQPMVRWEAQFADRAAGELRSVHGHVEVRWSHGRFNGPPEAKVYLDTPFDAVPGYWPVT